MVMSRPETLAGNQRPVQSDWKTKFSAIFALNSSTDYIPPRVLEFTVLGLKMLMEGRCLDIALCIELNLNSDL